MTEKKAEESNTQRRITKKMARIVLLAMIVMLLLLGISSLFFILRSAGKDAPLAVNTETPFPTPSSASVYLETPPAQAEFYDTFKNNAQGWSISSTAGYYRAIKPGELILTNTNSDTTMVESLPTNMVFDNGTLIVDFTILKANVDDSLGIYIRGDTNLEHDYRIDINGNGTIDIAKEYLDSRNNPQSIMLVEPRSVSSLNPQGDMNTIVLTMSGSRLQLYINNMKTGIVVDGDYLAGQVALFAHLGGNSHEVAVSFSRIEIDKISGTLAGPG